LYGAPTGQELGRGWPTVSQPRQDSGEDRK